MKQLLITALLIPVLSAPAATRYVNKNSATPLAPYTTKATAAHALAPAVAYQPGN